MPPGTPGVKPDKPKDQGDLHRQIALFLLACHRSEHCDNPHPVDVRWMLSVIRRIASQRDQAIGFSAEILKQSLLQELDRLNTPAERTDPILEWALDRLKQAQNSGT